MNRESQITYKDTTLKKIGAATLGPTRVEDRFRRILQTVESLTADITISDVDTMIEQVPNTQLQQALTDKRGKQARDSKLSDTDILTQLRQAATTNIHGQLLVRAGQHTVARAEEPIAVDALPQLDYNLLQIRAQSLMTPRTGMTFGESVKRQYQRRKDLQGELDNSIYETAQSRAMAEKLRDAGYPEAAVIPWMIAEGPVEMSAEIRLEMGEFMGTAALASSFVRELYIDNDRLANNMGMDETQQRNFQTFADTVRATLSWKMPDYVPNPRTIPGLKVPHLFSRPDLVRTKDANGKVRFVATELENSPGGTGMMQILYAGYDKTPDLAEKMYEFVKTTEVVSAETPVDRNRLTVLMTEDWAEYRQEIEIFLREMQDVHGIDTSVYTMEELAELSPEERNERMKPGFVYHFAYSWNFFKNPDTYHVQLLRNPQKLADMLGLPLNEILKVDPTQLDTTVQGVEQGAKQQFLDTLSLPTQYLEDEYKRQVYRDDIMSMRSSNGKFKGRSVREIGGEIAQTMADTATSVYQRQGQDLVVFNDPSMSTFLNTKVGLTVYHTPGFSEYFEQYMQYIGYTDEEASQKRAMIQEMIGESAPLALDNENDALQAYARDTYERALADKNDWIVKLSVDPEFGSFDWGARSVVAGESIKTHADWEAFLQKAAASNLPWVLQRKVSNLGFTEPRTNKQAGSIPADSEEQIGVFARDPQTSRNRFRTGELVLSGGSTRYNPFLFTDVSSDEVSGIVADGIVTVKVETGAVEINTKGGFRKVHGSTDAAMIPLL